MNKIKYILLIISLITVAKFSNAQDFELHKTLTGHRAEITHINFRSEDNLLVST